MKWLIIPSILFVFLGCSHSIRRYGYEIDKSIEMNDTCQIVFFKEMPTDTLEFKRIGRIKLGDTGFSSNCDEEDALRIIEREACELRADAVNIIEETRPNFWSTCYRAEAEFLKKTKATIEITGINDADTTLGEILPESYKHNTSSNAVMTRVKTDKKRKVLMALITCGAGLMLGFIMTWHP